MFVCCTCVICDDGCGNKDTAALFHNSHSIKYAYIRYI